MHTTYLLPKIHICARILHKYIYMHGYNSKPSLYVCMYACMYVCMYVYIHINNTARSSRRISLILCLNCSSGTNCFTEESIASLAPKNMNTRSGFSLITTLLSIMSPHWELYPENPRFNMSTR